ncbi:MAG: nitroreductase [Gammaproteobacteria bacterium]|nr:nitroreductase [Gammaproteobacteria bacterium]
MDNEVLKVIKERRSIRKFIKDKMPSENQIKSIVEAGLYAPSGRGTQCPIILAITNKEIRDKLSKLNAEIAGMAPNSDPFYGAPVVLIVLVDKMYPLRVYDGSLVMQNLMLAAQSLGLGSIWIHRAKQEFERPEGIDLLKELGLEGEYEGIGHCCIGYIDGPVPEAAPRKANRVIYIK